MLSNQDIFASEQALRSVYRESSEFNGSFHWIEAGWQHSETVLLLHGVMAHSIAFRKVVEPLAYNYRVILPDMPAHGSETTFHSKNLKPRVDAIADWLALLSEEVSGSRLHLVGHSLGALASLIAVENHPRLENRIQSLTLVSPGLDIDVPSWTSYILNWLPNTLAQITINELGLRLIEPVQWQNSTLNQWEVDSYLSPLKEKRRLQYILKLLGDLTKNGLSSSDFDPVEPPTLLIWGENDHLLPVETGRRIASVLDDASLEVIENSGHSPMEDFPDQFVRLLTEFISNEASYNSLR